MTVRCINNDCVDTCIHQQAQALFKIIANANSRADTQTAHIIFTGIGVFTDFFDILDGNQTLKGITIINNEQFLNAVLMEMFFGLFECGTRRNGDQFVFGHDI